jgi:hypothetical protein
MANKSIDTAVAERRLDANRAAERKAAKHRQIDAVHRLAVNRQHCFRTLLLEELGATTERRRRSLARWLMQRVFSERRRVGKAHFCCDSCNPEDAARYIGEPRPALAPLGSVQLETAGADRRLAL